MSLLKRIEQGRQTADEDPNAAGGSRLGTLEARRVSPPRKDAQDETYADLKVRVQNRLLAELDPSIDVSEVEKVRGMIRDLFEQILTEESIVLSRQEKHRLFEQIAAEILGFGPLQPLLEDNEITEVMVNGAKSCYFEKAGKINRAPITFESDEHVMRIIDRIVAPLGRRIDESSPYVDARLPDGSRVNAVIPPISLVGPCLTIRKFSKDPFTVEQLIDFGSLTPSSVLFMEAAVKSRFNVIISGGTGSGKTTLLNVLSAFIPNDERIITVENAAELQMRQDHVVTLESRPPNIEGRGEVTIRQLVINTLRMRPDRIIVGEIRGEESLDMLQAMNTGHDGSLTTAHSNSPRDTLARVETMALMAGMDLPVRAIREQIASAIDLIIHQSRMQDGSRKVVNITEVIGMEGDVITMQDIFRFEQTAIEDGKVLGELVPTGLRPKYMDKIEAHGIHLPPSIFSKRAGA
jgi:pilus assembly protein CpaF